MTGELKKQIADFLTNLGKSIEKAVDAGEYVAIIRKFDMVPEANERTGMADYRYMGGETMIAIGRPAMMATHGQEGGGVVYVISGPASGLQAASKNGILSD